MTWDYGPRILRSEAEKPFSSSRLSPQSSVLSPQSGNRVPPEVSLFPGGIIMRRIATVTLWGLLAGFLAFPALAAESRGFEVSVLVDGYRISEYPWQGRTYVEALRGRSFTLRVSNPTAERVAVAISVDGRNVVDAKRTGERAATKWVLDPWQTLDIPGWQVSGDTARRFFFTETARSYAKWLGDTSNVGTIEAVFFRGRHRTPPIALESPRDREWEGQAQGRASVEGGSSQNSAGG